MIFHVSILSSITIEILSNFITVLGFEVTDEPCFSMENSATFWCLSQGTSSVPAAATVSTVTSGDLDLFTDQTTKSEEVAKKQLSKDSILSLYGAGTIQQQSTPGNAL